RGSRGDEAAPHRDQRCQPEQRDPDRSQGRLITGPGGPPRSRPRGISRAAFSQRVLETEAVMRPTTAIDDNVFDIDYLLHPGTRFEHPRDVVSHPGPSLEAGHLGFLGFRRISHRVLSLAAGARRAEGAGHHRRDPGGAVRTGWWSPAPAWRQTHATATDRTACGSLKPRPFEEDFTKTVTRDDDV